MYGTMSTSTADNNTQISRLNIVNLAAYVLNVAFTFGIGLGGLFNLPSNGELSLKYQTLVTPVGWAFSIWSIIFLVQLLWVILQIALKQQRNSEWITKVGYNYLWVCLAQAGWTLAFSNEIIALSLLFMTFILLFLWRIIFTLTTSQQEDTTSWKNYCLWKFPFTIHGGWITAATAVNASVVLVAYNVASQVQFYVAIASVFVLLLFAVAVIWKLSEQVVPLVLAWALFGVFVELKSATDSIISTFTDEQIQQTQYGAVVAAILILVGVLVGAILRLRRPARNAEETQYLRHDD
jgi:hypothetical protein